jgi:hypothetical protein
VEHGQVRRQLVSIGGVMMAAQAIEPGEIGGRQLGGDDQRP